MSSPVFIYPIHFLPYHVGKLANVLAPVELEHSEICVTHRQKIYLQRGGIGVPKNGGLWMRKFFIEPLDRVHLDAICPDFPM